MEGRERERDRNEGVLEGDRDLGRRRERGGVRRSKKKKKKVW